jgi:riboflavin transporter FmnP
MTEGAKVIGLSENEKSISQTFEYFFLWVIPFWWFYILLASIITAIITILISKLINRFKKT